MSNHLHLLLRSRPDVVEEWNDNEAAPSVADADFLAETAADQLRSI
jgi:hypothetical protein